MKYCGNCGNSVEDNAGVCPKCGQLFKTLGGENVRNEVTPGKKLERPTSSYVLVIIGWLTIVFSVLVGLFFSRFIIIAAVICWGAGIVSGTLFIGLGKIIELLTIIANKE